MWRICIPVALVAWSFVGSVLAAEPAVTELGVDLVAVKRGPRLLGAIVDRASDGTLTVAVSRAWLKGAHPRSFEEYRAAETVEHRLALEELRDRLKEWQKARPEPKTLAFFLNKEADRVTSELARLEKPGGDEPEPEFLLVSVPAANAERVVVQPPQRKQVAVVAWKEGLARVESRSVASLTKELEQRKIDVAKQRVDLSDRFPIRRQSADEWAARQAIVEFQLREPLDFQGTGDVIVQTGDKAPAPATGELLMAILRSQLEGQLADLLAEPGAKPAKRDGESEGSIKKASTVAEKADALGLRITRVTPDVAGGKVRVESQFVAKLANGKWKTVWSHSEQQDPTKVDPDVVDRIAQDPQVKGALEAIKSSGIVGGDAALRQALQFGAGTMQAQQAADERFLEFRDRYLQHLDVPLLPLLQPQ